MNQTTNLIQWKNLTQEQKDDFDFENYKYEVQRSTNGVDFYTSIVSMDGEANSEKVYRLVIENDKWYTYGAYDLGHLYEHTAIGKDLTAEDKVLLRPARPNEIPQTEKTLEQKIQDKWPDKEVVMLAYNGKHQELTFPVGILDRYHFTALSMKGFHSYVYQRPQDGSFFRKTVAVVSWNSDITLQPIAVLFEEEEC